MAKTAAQRKQASRARQKEQMGEDAFNEKNNAAQQASRACQKEQMGEDAFNEKNNITNRKYQLRIKEQARLLAATEESGTGGGLSQMPTAIHRRKVRENRDAKFGKGTVQKERHDEYANQNKKRIQTRTPPGVYKSEYCTSCKKQQTFVISNLADQ